MPLKRWDRTELQMAGAMDTGATMAPDLDRPLLDFFSREHWEVTDADYALLMPSMRLATYLIRIGMPYIATFLPSENVFGPSRGHCPADIPLKDPVTADDLVEAEKELREVAQSTRWQINNEMFEDHGWLGITMLAPVSRPWGVVTQADVEASDEAAQRRGELRRPLIIGIMGEYVRAIRDSAQDSEQHLRAIFMAAITMTHEVGHVIFHQDYRSLNPPNLAEPHVGDSCDSEIGFSFICWIFNGYTPDLCDLGDKTARNEFKTPLHWLQYYKTDIGRRPLYKTLYSISIPWIQEKLTQAFWTALERPTTFEFSRAAQPVLIPHINLLAPAPVPATAATAEWIISRVTSGPQWRNGFDFKLTNFSTGDPVVGLNSEEIAAARRNQGNDIPQLDAETVQRHEQFYRSFAKMRRGEMQEDDGDDFGPPDRGDDDGGLGSARDRHRHDDPDDSDSDPLGSVDDGLLEEDLKPPLEGPATPLTRIQVEYHLDSATAAKLLRAGDRHDDDDDDDLRGKRPRHGRRDSTSDDEWDISDDTDIDVWIRKHGNVELGKRLSHIQAYELCKKMNIRTPPVNSTLAWQLSKCDIHASFENNCLVSRIQEAFLQAKIQDENKRPVKRKGVLLKLKKESLAHVVNWGDQEVYEFCRAHGLSTRGDRYDMAVQVEDWKAMDLEMTRALPSGTATSPGHNNDNDNPPENIEDWTDKQLQLFCRTSYLLESGNRNALLARVRRYKRERSNGGRAPREAQRHRVDAAGNEKYVFQAILGRSSVSALKSSLFATGEFPPDVILALQFGQDIRLSAELEDHRPLNFYRHKDWTSLRLRVLTTDTILPADRKPPFFDLTKDDDSDDDCLFGSGAPGGAGGSGGKRALPAPPGYAGPVTKSAVGPPRKRAREALTATEQREEDIREGRVVPTVAERMKGASSHAPALERMLHLDGGRTQNMRPPGKPKTRSGERLQENLDDGGDDKMDHNRRVIDLTDGPDDDARHHEDVRGYLDDDEEIG